jgi:hypothetical protein
MMPTCSEVGDTPADALRQPTERPPRTFHRVSLAPSSARRNRVAGRGRFSRSPRRPPRHRDWATIATVGLLIRAVAAGQLRKHETLVTTGMLRHPPSLSRQRRAGSGLPRRGALVAGQPPLSCSTRWPSILRPSARKATATTIRTGVRGARGAHAHAPAAPRRSVGGAGFSWQTYRRNREYRAAAGAALGFLALYVRLWLSAHP